jgi:outer membrane protein, heavy metal efflux system
VQDTEQLVRCALAQNEAVARAQYEVDAARARTGIAARIVPVNPTLELGGGRRTAESGQSEYDRSIDLAQTFELGGQRGSRLAIARRDEQFALAALEAVRREVTAEVLNAVVAVWRARAVLGFSRDQHLIAEQLVEVSRARQRQGLGPALDVDLAQAAGVQARRDEAVAALDLIDSETRLAQAVGRDAKLVERAPLPSGFQFAGGLEALEQHALEHRRDVLAAQAETQNGRARMDLLRRERIPDVTASAGVHHEEFSNVLAARLSIPLPLFRRNQGEIAEQQARVAQADVTARQAELRARLEVRAAFAAWQRAAETARQVEPGLEDRLREDAGALRDAYARGVVPLPTALSSLREVQAARRNLASARVDAVLTSFQLARVSGYAAWSLEQGAP